MHLNFIESMSDYKKNYKLAISRNISETEQELDSLHEQAAYIECLIDFYNEFRNDLCRPHFDILIKQLRAELKENYKSIESLEDILDIYMSIKLELQQ